MLQLWRFTLQVSYALKPLTLLIWGPSVCERVCLHLVPPLHSPPPQRSLEHTGPAFVKRGQWMAIRSYQAPAERDDAQRHGSANSPAIGAAVGLLRRFKIGFLVNQQKKA